jgi:hypothetical protein
LLAFATVTAASPVFSALPKSLSIYLGIPYRQFWHGKLDYHANALHQRLDRLYDVIPYDERAHLLTGHTRPRYRSNHFVEATMAFHVRRIDYFSTTVRDDPGEAYQLLATLANLGVNLLAFAAVPIGPLHTQLTIFPEDSAKLANEAKMDRLVLDGPHPALLVQGDDELGALAGLHMKLMKANVNVYASTGVADGGGSFGYVVYVRPEQYSLAVAALGL